MAAAGGGKEEGTPRGWKRPPLPTRPPVGGSLTVAEQVRETAEPRPGVRGWGQIGFLRERRQPSIPIAEPGASACVEGAVRGGGKEQGNGGGGDGTLRLSLVEVWPEGVPLLVQTLQLAGTKSKVRCSKLYQSELALVLSPEDFLPTSCLPTFS